MHFKNQYANWWSKLLFKKKFEEQFFIPIPSSFIEKYVFKLLEKYKFNMDLSHIKIDRPIFITGLPRSGTTMLYNLLCAHENASFVTNSMNSFPDELCSIEWLRKKFHFDITGERFLVDSIKVGFGSPSEPLVFWGKWFSRDADSLFWDEKRRESLPPGKEEEIYRDIRKILWTFNATKENPRRFVCKYPLLQTEMRMVQDLFPDAKFIHIVRDSRQAANSLVKLHKLSNDQLKKIKHPTVDYVVPYPRVKKLQEYVEKFGAEDVRTTAHVWNDAIELVHQTVPYLKHFAEVRYEDILENPTAELKRLFDFSELSWPNHTNEKFFQELKGVGKIHHKNNYKDFAVIESITREMLRKLGYKTN